MRLLGPSQDGPNVYAEQYIYSKNTVLQYITLRIHMEQTCVCLAPRKIGQISLGNNIYIQGMYYITMYNTYHTQGTNVRLPGPSQDRPNVFAFGTPYKGRLYESHELNECHELNESSNSHDAPNVFAFGTPYKGRLYESHKQNESHELNESTQSHDASNVYAFGAPYKGRLYESQKFNQ